MDTGLLPRYILDKKRLLADRACIVVSILVAVLFLIDGGDRDPHIIGFALLFAALFLLRYDRTIDEFSMAKREGYRPGI